MIVTIAGGSTLVKYNSMSMSMFTKFAPFHQGKFGATLMMIYFCEVMPKRCACGLIVRFFTMICAEFSFFFDGLFLGTLNEKPYDDQPVQ